MIKSLPIRLSLPPIDLVLVSLWRHLLDLTSISYHYLQSPAAAEVVDLAAVAAAVVVEPPSHLLRDIHHLLDPLYY